MSHDQQLGLFPLAGHRACPSIDGLAHRTDFVDEPAARSLLGRIDNPARCVWSVDLERRVQHYGYEYDYRARRIDRSMWLGPLPVWLQALTDRVAQATTTDAGFDQVIINEYLPGQGIAAHTDCQRCFGGTVATLTLGAAAMMRFRELNGPGDEELWLEPGTLAILTGDARYRWTHEIARRKSDLVAGVRVPRRRRISVTFRSVITD